VSLWRKTLSQKSHTSEPNLSHTNSICLHFNCRLSPQQTNKKNEKGSWLPASRLLYILSVKTVLFQKKSIIQDRREYKKNHQGFNNFPHMFPLICIKL